MKKATKRNLISLLVAVILILVMACGIICALHVRNSHDVYWECRYISFEDKTIIFKNGIYLKNLSLDGRYEIFNFNDEYFLAEKTYNESVVISKTFQLYLGNEKSVKKITDYASRATLTQKGDVVYYTNEKDNLIKYDIKNAEQSTLSYASVIDCVFSPNGKNALISYQNGTDTIMARIYKGKTDVVAKNAKPKLITDNGKIIYHTSSDELLLKTKIDQDAVLLAIAPYVYDIDTSTNAREIVYSTFDNNIDDQKTYYYSESKGVVVISEGQRLYPINHSTTQFLHSDTSKSLVKNFTKKEYLRLLDINYRCVAQSDIYKIDNKLYTNVVVDNGNYIWDVNKRYTVYEKGLYGGEKLYITKNDGKGTQKEIVYDGDIYDAHILNDGSVLILGINDSTNDTNNLVMYNDGFCTLIDTNIQQLVVSNDGKSYAYVKQLGYSNHELYFAKVNEKPSLVTTNSQLLIERISYDGTELQYQDQDSKLVILDTENDFKEIESFILLYFYIQ